MQRNYINSRENERNSKGKATHLRYYLDLCEELRGRSWTQGLAQKEIPGTCAALSSRNTLLKLLIIIIKIALNEAIKGH